MNQSAHTDNRPSQSPLSVGFILAPEFTLSAFSNFVDVLRLAADEGDFSRQIRCKWKILSHDSRPILSSSGLEVIPTAGLEEPQHFDYIVVVGGLLHAGKKISPQIAAYLKQADEAGVTLIGVCTGSFILARAGLMHGYHSCVSWFHYHHFEQEFPKYPVSSDELFNIDGKRMTCAGGAGVMHLAAHLIEKHCGKFEAAQALRIMLEEMPLPASTPQPHSVITDKVYNRSVRKAVQLIERNISNPLTVDDIAQKVNVSIRHLERLFHAELGMTPRSYSAKLRLDHARHLILNTDHRISFIVFECGFVDCSHFSRRFKLEFGLTPTEMRIKRGTIKKFQHKAAA